jgi:hypothetical protein
MYKIEEVLSEILRESGIVSEPLLLTWHNAFGLYSANMSNIVTSLNLSASDIAKRFIINSLRGKQRRKHKRSEAQYALSVPIDSVLFLREGQCQQDYSCTLISKKYGIVIKFGAGEFYEKISNEVGAYEVFQSSLKRNIVPNMKKAGVVDNIRYLVIDYIKGSTVSAIGNGWINEFENVHIERLLDIYRCNRILRLGDIWDKTEDHKLSVAHIDDRYSKLRAEAFRKNFDVFRNCLDDIPVGFIHGGFEPGHVLKTAAGYKYIDFDGHRMAPLLWDIIWHPLSKNIRKAGFRHWLSDTHAKTPINMTASLRVYNVLLSKIGKSPIDEQQFRSQCIATIHYVLFERKIVENSIRHKLLKLVY